MIHHGGCFCGAVRFECRGEPINVRICHCRNCQKATGAPYFARALFSHEALTIHGDAARFPSSDALDRMFCPRCGTRLFSWRKTRPVVGVALACFDDPDAFAPTEHIWTSARIGWVLINDGLPQFPENPA
ncbi:GFA family protein [Bradyrhizobium sp. STM 3809]|uniref:GFA family protein n=1 Tax=Bradyrhizobium sp. STM 3809 TaxID=551936 RepID=UPI000240603D|nr:GFA family protein [Bradyrhizobium sp. STM 3809]CCD99436.1 conserved hypothetical protein [Bradyrhizobium sp. STM 3809]